MMIERQVGTTLRGRKVTLRVSRYLRDCRASSGKRDLQAQPHSDI